MNTEKFFEALKKMKPKVDYFLKQGYSADFAKKSVEGYSLKKNSNTSPLSIDPLLQLIEYYDIGIFNSLIFATLQNNGADENYYFIGLVHEDFLAIQKSTKEVVVLDYYRFNYERTIRFSCAENTEKFLDVLALYLTPDCPEYSNDDSVFNAYKKKKAISCSIQAGGEKYIDFYNYIYGIE